jgi:hypothetical protein
MTYFTALPVYVGFNSRHPPTLNSTELFKFKRSGHDGWSAYSILRMN